MTDNVEAAIEREMFRRGEDSEGTRHRRSRRGARRDRRGASR
jgi:hypothetical protein